MVNVRVPGNLFRSHVGGCAEGGPGLRECIATQGSRCGHRLRDTEVGDDGGTMRQEYVVRLDVAMHDAARMRVTQRARYVAQDADDLRDR